jgi:hypothetical protein
LFFMKIVLFLVMVLWLHLWNVGATWMSYCSGFCWDVEGKKVLSGRFSQRLWPSWSGQAHLLLPDFPQHDFQAAAMSAQPSQELCYFNCQAPGGGRLCVLTVPRLMLLWPFLIPAGWVPTSLFPFLYLSLPISVCLPSPLHSVTCPHNITTHRF